jgi:hypothetical protein
MGGADFSLFCLVFFLFKLSRPSVRGTRNRMRARDPCPPGA